MRILAILLVAAFLAGCAENGGYSAPTPTERTPETTPTPATGGSPPAPTSPPVEPTPDATPAPTPAPTSGGESSTSTAKWSFTAIDGQTYASNEPAGEASVMFFMATWCSSCRQKAPMLAQLQNEYGPTGVNFYSLDFDPSETRGDIERWQAQYDHDWPHGIDTGRTLQRQYSVTSQSTVLVFDGGGELVKHFPYGKVTESELRATLDGILSSA